MKKKLASLLALSICLVGYFVMTAQGDERELVRLRQKADQLLREAKEHAAQGHTDKARNIERLALRLLAKAKEVGEPREQREHEGEREGERHGHEQIEHIRQAAEHLHAAGLHEPAEDFLREVQERERVLERQREGHHDEGLHRHVEELAKHVRELQERLARIERAILDLSDRREK